MADEVWVSMRNGVLNLNDLEAGLKPHSPAFFTVTALPYDYDPKATCPHFMDALVEWQQDDAALQLLQDWAGYILSPGNPKQVFLLCTGPGGDGKSQYATICKALVGARNCEAVGLDAFEKDFGLEPLVGKLLNITGDANFVERIGEGTLKSITGGDSVSINRKFLPAITTVLKCKFMMNANDTPFFRDRSEGLWRRMLALEWKTLSVSKIIEDFANELIRTEISGIFNWALEGYHRVRRQGFRRTGTVATALDRARHDTQHELSFFEECIGRSEHDCKCYCDDLVREYKEWCTRNNVKAVLHETKLGMQLRKWLRNKLTEAATMEAEEISAFFEEQVDGVRKDRFRLRDSCAATKRKMYYRSIYLLKTELPPS